MNDTTNNNLNSSLCDNSLSKGQLSMSNLTNDNSSLSDTSNLQELSALPNTVAISNALSNTPQNNRSPYFCALYTPLLSDFTNASRFAKQYSHRVHYVRDWGWFLFDGTRWHLDDSNQIFALASASIQSYYDQAASLPKKSPERLWERHLKHAESSQSFSRHLKHAESSQSFSRHLKHAESSQSFSLFKSLLRIASTLPEINAPHTLFDADPALLTVLNSSVPTNSTRPITSLVPRSPLSLSHLHRLRSPPLIPSYLPPVPAPPRAVSPRASPSPFLWTPHLNLFNVFQLYGPGIV